ncbi:MAG: DNA gyrase inhibitor YacG [Mariprofundaceae bacterium]
MKSVLCPICKKQVQRQDQFFPFCSDRCRTLDISRWADGSYSIAGEPVADHDAENDRIH